MTSAVYLAARTASAARRPCTRTRADLRLGVSRLRWLPQICDQGALWGSAFLLTFPALAFGGVCYWVRYLVAMVSLGLATVWAFRLLASDRSSRLGVAGTRAARWSLALVGLLALPLLPLPPAVVQIVAPHTYAIYRQALPGWPEHAPFAELVASLERGAPNFSAGSLPVTRWRPVGLIPYQSATTLFTGAAYTILGAIVAFYPWSDRRRDTLTHLITAVIAIAAFEAVYGILQQPSTAPRIFWFACPSGACLGTYINPDHYAGLLEMVFPLIVARACGWFWIHRDRHLQPSDSASWRVRLARRAEALHDPAIGRALSLGGLALLLMVAMAVSGCRSAFAATLLSLAIMFPLLPLPWRPARLGIATLAGAMIVAGSWATFPGLSAKLANRDLWDEIHLTGTRALIAADTWDAVRDFPALGVGLGNFSAVFPAYRARTSRFSFRIEHAHNDYLEWLAEVGTPAAALSFGLLIWLGRHVVRALRRAGSVTSESLTLWGCASGTLALLLHSWTDYNLHVPANALVFAFLLGALVRLSAPQTLPVRSPRRRFVPLVGLALPIVGALVLWQRWETEAAFRRVFPDGPRSLGVSEPAATGGDALALLQRATIAAPAAPDFQYELGRRLLERLPAGPSDASAGDRHAAIGAFLRSVSAAPLNPDALFGLVRAADGLDASAPGALRDMAARAAALAPHNPALRLDIAEWLLARWETPNGEEREQAGRQIEAALALAAPVPSLQSRRLAIIDTYERARRGDQTRSGTHA